MKSTNESIRNGEGVSEKNNSSGDSWLQHLPCHLRTSVSFLFFADGLDSLFLMASTF
jgi:hypothetical protein